jgi:hypothetical protein
MSTETRKTTPILEIAWTRVAQLDAIASRRSKSHISIRRWIAVLGVLATLFAILTQLSNDRLAQINPVLSVAAQALFIATPFLASTLAAIASKKYSNGDWLITRAGAEEIKKEVYFYRTVLQKDETRRRYLEDRLANIQRQIHRALNGEFSFEDYKGPVPKSYNPAQDDSDPGFEDLTGDQYLKYRLENQLNWHNRKINQFKVERDRLMVSILVVGALGSILATLGASGVWGGQLSIWVALTASITAALIGWQELRNIDVITRNYSKVVLELTVLRDHWLNLEAEERTTTEFYKLVRDCEEVLWAQNTEYIKSMQETLRDHSFEEDANLVNNIVQKLDKAAQQTKLAMQEHVDQVTDRVLEESGQRVEQTFQTTLTTLADDFMSEVVQKELDSMSRAAIEAGGKLIKRASPFSSTLEHLAREYSDVEIGRDTSKEEINRILASYPKTGDIKG